MAEAENNNQGAKAEAGRKSGWREHICLPDKRSHAIFWGVTVFGIVADLWSKSAVFDYLANTERGAVDVISGFFRLVMVLNEGAAFGMAAGRRWLLAATSIAAFVGILIYFFCSGKESRVTHFAMALFTGGLCGNLYDRLFNDGLVRDFIDIVYWPGKHWPAFNIADSLLCVGVGLLMLSYLGLFTGRSSQKPCPPQK